MRYILGLSAITCLFILSCNSGQEKGGVAKDEYEHAKESLEQRERKNPVDFLTVNSKDKRNFVGQTVIKGNISNNAKVCTYKDISLELSFYSKTGALLEKDKETIFETVALGKEVDFKTKYFTPKGTDSVSIKVLSAKYVEE